MTEKESLVPRTSFGEPLLDGDMLFAATTNTVENPKINDNLLGHIACEVMWDAVLSSIPKDDNG